MKYTVTIVTILLIILFIFFNYVKEPFILLSYKGGGHFEENVVANKNVMVDQTISTKELCPMNSTNCANNKNFAFVKDNMPKIYKDRVCIGDECITYEDLNYFKNLQINKTKYIKLKVVSSGTVNGVRSGLSEFYINDKKINNLPIGRGLNIMIVDLNGNVANFQSFDTHLSYEFTKVFIKYVVDWIPDKYYVLVSCYDECSYRAIPRINIYEHVHSKGWKKTYHLNSDGSDTKLHSTWSDSQNTYGQGSARIPNDSITSVDVSPGITAVLYEHDESGKPVTLNGPIVNYQLQNNAFNDMTSSIIIKKTDPNMIVSPFEALKKCGGTGMVAPNYRGSFIFIGVKNADIGTAYEGVKNSNGSNDTKISFTKSIKNDKLLYNILNK